MSEGGERMNRNSKSEDRPGVDGVDMDDPKDIIWNCRLKLQILKEFFYDADSCPAFENYQAWAEGITLLLTEIIEAQEELHSSL